MQTYVQFSNGQREYLGFHPAGRNSMAMISREQQVSSNFDRLPLVLVAKVLQHVEQSERLSSCAAVCKCWAAAAAAATVNVDRAWPFDAPHVLSEFPNCVRSLQPWLEQHAKQLVSLRLMPCRYWQPNPQLQLPCSDLQQLSSLQLRQFDLDVLGDSPQHSSSGKTSSSSSSQLIPTMLPKLGELQLETCKVSPTFLAQMLQLSGLSCLKLQQLDYSGLGSLGELDVYSTMLPRLPKLAHLELSCSRDITPVAKMLPSSLTALTLHGKCWPEAELSCRQLTQLVHLQKLDLCMVKFNPMMITSMTKLLQLQLQHCALLDNDDEGADGSTVMLAAIGGMRQLEHLSVVGDGILWNFEDVPARHFSALTASTHLTHLELDSNDDQPLPAGAVQHMFPAGKQFPALQKLTVCADELCAGPGYITTPELRSIITACPAINSLKIAGVLQPVADIHALLQLPSSCRSLGVGGEAFGEAAAVVIAQLTQLTSLSWVDSPDVTEAGLDRLTALQALEGLELRGMDGLSDGLVCKEEDCMVDEFKLTAGDQPVWQQLHDKIRNIACNATWSHRLEVQEQETSIAKLQLGALSSYMDHALAVAMFCSGSAEVMQAVRSMADLGRKVLSGTVFTAGVGGAAVGTSDDADVAGLVQQYRELQEPVKEFCRDISGSEKVLDVLACMEAAVLRAIEDKV